MVSFSVAVVFYAFICLCFFTLWFLRVFLCKESQSAPDLSGVTTKILEGVKHPLEHSWSFWMFTNDKKKWEDNLIELTAFNTVEDYWS